MTLDEAIIHAEEVAKKKFRKATSMPTHSVDEFGRTNEQCEKCAEDHRQLAAWLRDYKRLLAIESGIDVRCGNCKHDDTDDGICESCFEYRRWEEME